MVLERKRQIRRIAGVVQSMMMFGGLLTENVVVGLVEFRPPVFAMRPRARFLDDAGHLEHCTTCLIRAKRMPVFFEPDPFDLEQRSLELRIINHHAPRPVTDMIQWQQGRGIRNAAILCYFLGDPVNLHGLTIVINREALWANDIVLRVYLLGAVLQPGYGADLEYVRLARIIPPFVLVN